MEALNYLPEAVFQKRADNWVITCFGIGTARNTVERSHRFIEEALELYQASGGDLSSAQKLAVHVFAKPEGVIADEVGGTMVTLASLCSALGVDMEIAADDEIRKLWQKIVEKRAKHFSKDPESPLPGQNPKTVIQWLKGLPEPYNYEAVELCTSGQEVNSIQDALKDAFMWAETPQGFDYWNDLYKTL